MRDPFPGSDGGAPLISPLISPVIVIGIGSELAGDDAAGLEVARRLREEGAASELALCELGGDLTALPAAWREHQAAVLVDAMRSGAKPGSIRRMRLGSGPLPTGLRASSSTHAIGLETAIELARAIDQMPPHVILYAVEGERFQIGAAISPRVSAALPMLTEAVLLESRALARGALAGAKGWS
jgi:hydrogenase maturation protease